ncbi:MAG: hypothetical protein AAFQ63_13180 [Cyanobacteria bacterium J06621_11]
MRCLSEDRVEIVPMDEQKGERKSEQKSMRFSADKTANETIDSTASSLTEWILLAMSQAKSRRRLLQQRSLLNDILKNISARRLLHEQATSAATLSERRKALALIVDIMKASRRIWRGGAISTQVYDEAIARNWDWFCAQISTYDPEKASFVTWFNARLKWRILEESRLPLAEPSEAVLSKAASNVVMPSPYAWENLLEEWISLVACDQQLMNCRMRQHLRLSCQGLLLSILQALQETGVFSWEAIAQHQGIEPDVLKRFCRRRCFARFKELTGED